MNADPLINFAAEGSQVNEQSGILSYLAKISSLHNSAPYNNCLTLDTVSLL